MHLDPEGLARDVPRGRTWRAQPEAPLSRARAPGPDGRCDRAADTRLRAFSPGVSGQSRDTLDCLWTVSGSPLLDRPWTVSGPPLMDCFWTDRLWTAFFFFLRFFSIPYAITNKGSVHRTPLFLDRLWTIFGTSLDHLWTASSGPDRLWTASGPSLLKSFWTVWTVSSGPSLVGPEPPLDRLLWVPSLNRL